MVYRYKTIKQESEGFYKDKGSKFISKAYPVSSLEEINQLLELLRKEYYDARHHCYAYILNPESDVFRANDDGEPNHSAGDPILGQIRSLEITNTLIVVIRYFGGTKLGVSGLINAYKTAAHQALQQADVLEIEVTKQINFIFSYPDTNTVMKWVGKFQIKILSQEYETECRIEGTMPIANLEHLIAEVELLNNLGTKIGLKH